MKLTLLTAAAALFLSAPASANDFDNTVMPKLKNAHSEIMNDTMMDKEVMEIAPVRAVAFHSDNCGSCKILGPRLMETAGAFEAGQFEIVKFDMTNKQSIEETKQLAAEKGVDNILQKYGAKTGFVVLVNAQGEEVDMLKVDHNIEDMTTKINNALEKAA